MAAPAHKEIPMAFMSSPNDTIPYPDGVFPKRAASESGRTPSFSFDGASASQQQGSSKAEEALQSPTDASAAIPIREQVSTASKLPEEEAKRNGAQSDEEFWYQQYVSARNVIHSMQDMWKKECDALQQKIATLEEALKKGKGAVNGLAEKESNDAAFGAPDIVRESQEKLRSLSIVSYTPPVSLMSPEKTPGASFSSVTFQPLPPTEMSHTAAAPGAASLASIPEDDNGLSVEDPPSPPATAKIPTPPYLRAHAGHTPRLPISELPSGDLNPAFLRPGQADSEAGVVARGENAIPPQVRLLPSKPKDASDLSTLNEKLQTVASDPELAVPVAIKGQAASPILERTSISLPAQEEPLGEEINGVRLKKKQSINFGMPLLQGVKMAPRSPTDD